MRQLLSVRTIGVALGAILVCSAASAHADETERVISPAVTSGLVLFGVTYGASVIVATTSDHQGDKRLFVPLLGPWLDLGDRGTCGIQNQSCDRETTYKILLVTDGVLQAASVFVVLGGVLRSGHDTARTASGIHVVPVSFAHGSPGMVAFGRF